MQKLDCLLYLDEKYVEYLYNLYFTNVTEITIEKSRDLKKHFEAEADMLKIFPVSMNTEGEIELSKVDIHEETVKPDVVNKVVRILYSHFQMQPIILRELIRDMKENGIYYFQGKFELISIKSVDGKDLIKNGKYRKNPEGLEWNLRLVTYDKKKMNVAMVLGGEKILVHHRHLTREIEKYKRFIFNVLGRFKRKAWCTNFKFQAKSVVY